MKRKGNVRYYEWRIDLGEQLIVGKSVGLDFQFFDKDTDGSFTINSWGKGGSKIRIPGSLGDVVLLPENQKMSTVQGNVSWDRKMNITTARIYQDHICSESEVLVDNRSGQPG